MIDKLLKIITKPSYDYGQFMNDYNLLPIKIDDPLFPQALKIIVEMRKSKTSEIQRYLSIGYARSARLIDCLEDLQIIGASRGSKDREIYVKSYLEAYKIIRQNISHLEHYSSLSKNKDLVLKNSSLAFKGIKSGLEFEAYCAQLLLNSGFVNVKVTQASNDYGVDIIAIKDEIKYAIQCKFYSENVGNSAVQEVCTGRDYYDCHIGVVMTNAHFTSNAIELARKNRVLLWDHEKLIEFIDASSSE